MKNPAMRKALAAAGLLCFLGLYGCNEDSGSASSSQGNLTAAAPQRDDWPSTRSLRTLSEASDTASRATAPAPMEKVKALSSASFDGNKEQKNLSQSEVPPVVADPNPNKKIETNAVTQPVKLDDPAKAPPPVDANASACEAVLKSHDQDESGCKDHARTSLTWAGIKDGFASQFGSAQGWIVSIMATLLGTLIGYVATGGWALLVKILLTLAKWGSVVAILGQAAAFFKALMQWKNAQEGSEEWAEGIWGMARAGTIIAVIAGLFAGGKYAGSKLPASEAAAAGGTAAAEQPGLGTRLWQGVSGWWGAKHA